MKQKIKRWIFALLGKDPEAVVVSFCTGDPELCRRMVEEVRSLVPDRRHFTATPENWFTLRRELKRYRVGLAPVMLAKEAGALRLAAYRLAPRKILAYNSRLERHHLGLNLASFLFWRGVPLDRIWLRPRWWPFPQRERTTTPDTIRRFEGRPCSPARPRVAVLSPYFPYPLSHGGAVRIYHLLREMARDFDVELFAFDSPSPAGPTPPTHAPASLAPPTGPTTPPPEPAPSAPSPALGPTPAPRDSKSSAPAAGPDPTPRDPAPSTPSPAAGPTPTPRDPASSATGQLPASLGPASTTGITTPSPGPASSAPPPAAGPTPAPRGHEPSATGQLPALLAPASTTGTTAPPPDPASTAPPHAAVPPPAPSHPAPSAPAPAAGPTPSDPASTPPAPYSPLTPVLEFCARVVLVEQPRYRAPRWSTLLPPEVHEFRSPAMRRAIDEERRSFGFQLLQVEYTQLAEYGGDILVEHDVTFDLYGQIARRDRTLSAWWDCFRWRRFERRALRRYRHAVVMSDKDAAMIGPSATVLENGVDLARFQSTSETPGQRLLFIGSFRHFPNISAFRFFLESVWPLLRDKFPDMTVTVVCGPDHLLYWREFTNSPEPPSDGRIQMLGFVPDVRPLYDQANLVIVPTTVSAGTNVKVLEAMAMRRAVVSTTSGCAGLGLLHGHSVWVADTPHAFAAGIATLIGDPERRSQIAEAAWGHAHRNFDWQAIGEKLRQLLLRSLEPGN